MSEVEEMRKVMNVMNEEQIKLRSELRYLKADLQNADATIVRVMKERDKLAENARASWSKLELVYRRVLTRNTGTSRHGDPLTEEAKEKTRELLSCIREALDLMNP